MFTYPLSTMWNINLYVTHYIDGIVNFINTNTYIKEYIFSKTIAKVGTNKNGFEILFKIVLTLKRLDL